MADSSSLLCLGEDLLDSSILRHLGAADLGCLACTCKQLLGLIAGMSSCAWLAAAAKVLWAHHPALHAATASQPTSAASLRAQLLRHSRACCNLRAGVYIGELRSLLTYVD